MSFFRLLKTVFFCSLISSVNLNGMTSQPTIDSEKQQPRERITYSTEKLLILHNSPLSKTMPQGMLYVPGITILKREEKT